MVTLAFGIETEGAVLQTSVALPHGDAPFSTVVIRTPHGISSKAKQVQQWTRRGYAVVVQDVRGRFASSGRWEPFVNEAADGGALVDWVRTQEWSNSRVVVYGSSYSAHCALAAAVSRPSEVCAAIVVSPPVRTTAFARESTGAPRLSLHVEWWSRHGAPRLLRTGRPQGANADYRAVLGLLPVARVGELVAGPNSPLLDGWRVGHRLHSPEFETYDPVHPLTRIPKHTHLPPLLVVCGVHDSSRDDALALGNAWQGARCDVVLGFWHHGNDQDRRFPRPPLPHRNQRRSMGEFVSAWIRDVDRNPARIHHRILVAQEGTADWARVEEHETPMSEHVLHPVRRRFVGQPRNPHPGVHGCVDLSFLRHRFDYAVFRTDVVSSAIDIVGTPRLFLRGLTTRNGPYSTLDGPADWALRLCSGHRGRGSGPPVLTQISNTLARTGAERIEALPMPFVARRLHEGDYLELHVSSHQFPLYARGPQDGTEPLRAEVLRTAQRAVTGDVVVGLPQAHTHRSNDPIQALLE